MSSPVQQFREFLKAHKELLEAAYKSSIIFQIESKLAEMGVVYYDSDFPSTISFDVKKTYEMSKLKMQADIVLEQKGEETQRKIIDSIYAQEKIAMDAHYFFKDPPLPIYKDPKVFEDLMRRTIDKIYHFLNIKTGQFFGRTDFVAEDLQKEFFAIVDKDFQERCQDFSQQFAHKIPILGPALKGFAYKGLREYGQERFGQEKEGAQKHSFIWAQSFTHFVQTHVEAKLDPNWLLQQGCDLSVEPDDEHRSVYGQMVIDFLQNMRNEHEAIPIYIDKLLELKKEERIMLKGEGGERARKNYQKALKKFHDKLLEILPQIQPDDPSYGSMIPPEHQLLEIFTGGNPPETLYVKQYAYLLLMIVNSTPDATG